MVRYDLSYVSANASRRMFVLALFISLFVHLIAVFAFKVKFIEVKYPGDHWVDVSIKDDMWFESGVELPSASEKPDQKEMDALFHYPFDSGQLHLLRPPKPKVDQILEKAPTISLKIKQPTFLDEKLNLSSIGSSSILSIPFLKSLQSKEISKENIALMSPNKFKQDQLKLIQSKYMDLRGPAKTRKILNYKLPDFSLRSVLKEDDYQFEYSDIQIKFWIKSDGHIGFTRLLHSSGYPVLDAHALLTLKSWQFEPVSDGDIKFLDQWGEVTFRFYEGS